MPGWARTGQIVNVFAATAHVASPQADACSASSHGRGAVNASVDTRSLACDAAARRLPNIWPQSSGDAPTAAVPNESDGSCGAGTIPVYGLYDNRPNHNRRYTTSLATRDQLRAIGWSAEGAGPLGVVMMDDNAERALFCFRR